MLFHPRTLELLHQYKSSDTDIPPLSLVALLTDYTSFIKISDLFSILFSYTSKGNIDILKNILINNTRIVIHNGIDTCIWPTPPHDIEEIILKNRTGPQRYICFSALNTEPCNYVQHLQKIEEGVIVSFNNNTENKEDAYNNKENYLVLNHNTQCRCSKKKRTRKSKDVSIPTSEPDITTLLSSQSDIAVISNKKQRIQFNPLNFQRLEAKQAKQIERFTPIDLTGSFFVYDRNSIRLETLRKRDDLHRPIKLQFIKHYDQRRLPIYRPRGMIIKNPFSYKKMKEVISYDNDSSEEWEECGEDSALEMSSDEFSESTGGSDAGSLVSADSSSSAIEEPRKRLKKPVFIFNAVLVVIYFESDKYSNAPLVLSKEIPLEIFESLNELRNENISMDKIAELYNVEEQALIKYYENISKGNF